ncbi:MAG: hypothetical protein V4726_23160 [Verrucomicrobiota bacterium]
MKPPPLRALALLILACPFPAVLRAQESKKTAHPPAKTPADPALAALETQYAAERTSDLLAGLARYADELAALQKTLLTAGDTAGAARVQLELDRLLPVIAPVTANPPPDGNEFSLFDEPAAVPSSPATLSADTATPADLESLLRALQPMPAAAAASGNPGGTAPKPGSSARTGKTAKRLLKMASAQLTGSYFPESGYLYWHGPGRRAIWTLSDLPTTSCLVVLRYACDEKIGGGRLSVSVGTTKVEVDVPSTGSWTRYRDLTIGPLAISDSRADLALEVASLKAGATALMDLKAVMVILSEP